jgi:hypothetical protein
MNQAPLARLAAALIFGIVIAHYTPVTFFVFAVLSLLALLGSLYLFKIKRFSVVCIFLAIALLGGAIFRDSQTLPPHHISNFTPHKSKRVSVEGLIESDPVKTKRGCKFILSALPTKTSLPAT